MSRAPASSLRVLAIANQKGGVGKTTTAINLGTALAAIGEKVLILDLDPQGNASTGVGVPDDARPITSFDVLAGKATITRAASPTLVPNLSIVPANAVLPPRNDGIVLGHVNQRGNSSLEIDEAARDRILNNAIAFFGAMKRDFA